MSFSYVRTCALIAALFAVAALPFTTALAEEPANSAPTPPISLDPNMLKPPAPATESPPTVKPLRDGAGSKIDLPTKFDLGTSELRLDTSRKAVDSIPRVGIDAADPKVLNPNLPQEKDSPLKPDYFGITISTPTH
jgi:hypothetical protein